MFTQISVFWALIKIASKLLLNCLYTFIKKFSALQYWFYLHPLSPSFPVKCCVLSLVDTIVLALGPRYQLEGQSEVNDWNLRVDIIPCHLEIFCVIIFFISVTLILKHLNTNWSLGKSHRSLMVPLCRLYSPIDGQLRLSLFLKNDLFIFNYVYKNGCMYLSTDEVWDLLELE